MTDTTTTPRTAHHIHLRDQPREDDGYFGPESITWRVYADPSGSLGGVAAVLLQSLHPGMMRLLAQVSKFYSDPEGRSRRTESYLETVVYGDKAHADAAARVVRTLHERSHWTDPDTGEELHADTPAWQHWTHNTFVWGLLRAADAFGPELTAAEQDRFVVEQHRGAELLGLDPAQLPSTRAELDAYIDAQQSIMALTLAAARFGKNLRKPSLKGNPVSVFIGINIQDGILSLLPDWAIELWGIEGRPMSMRLAARTTRSFLNAARKKDRYDAVLARLTSGVEDHPYARVHAPRGPGRR